MKKFLCFTAACFFAVALTGAAANAQTTNCYQSYIDVNGYAEKEVAPDVFYMQIELNEQDSKGRKSLEDQQSSMVSALKAIGIDTEKQLTRLSLSSEYYNRRTNLSRALYQLKLSKSEDVAKVWSKMDALGISNVSFTKAEYSKIKELQNEIQQEAVRNARAQAQAMAEAIDQKIGKCFYIYCSHSGSPAVYGQARMTKGVMMNSAMDAVEEEAAIEFTNIKVTASVSTKFTLE